MITHLCLFLTALLASLVAVPALRSWALASGILDVPDERKVHSGKIPRLGGVAIFLAFVLALSLFVELSATVGGILVGALVLFITGLIDDLFGLSSLEKFVGEILGGTATVFISGLYITELGNLFGTGSIVLPVWLAIPFTVFAVVGVINAINLIDGLDGLSGGVTLIALGAFMLLGVSAGNLEVTLLCAALIGAVLGFLKYNAYPARIFMGDVGSLVVGFVLAFLAIQLTQTPGAQVQAVVPLLILGLPIVDTIRVLGLRLLRGGSPFLPDMTHIHHKLMDIGFNHQNSVLVIYGFSLFWAVTAVMLRNQPAWQLLLLFVALSTSGYLLLYLIACRQQKTTILPVPLPAGQKRSLLGYGPVVSALLAVLFRNL